MAGTNFLLHASQEYSNDTIKYEQVGINRYIIVEKSKRRDVYRIALKFRGT